MRTIVDGVAILLTDEQIKHIELTKKKRDKEASSFSKVLKSFGFEKKNGGYINEELNAWGEIIDHGPWKEVWLTCEHTKSISSIPGGWCYGCPKELSKELFDAKERVLAKN